MPQAALQSSQVKRSSKNALSTVHRYQRTNFNWISKRCACAVALSYRNLAGSKTLGSQS
jgi:hypothetical protein